MKKVLLAFVVMVLCSFSSFAGVASLFEVDEVSISAQFEDLNALEDFLTANENATLEDVAALQSSLVNKLNLDMNSGMKGIDAMLGEPPLGINSFIWGFCLGATGILIVYLVLDDTDRAVRQAETKKALWGCVTSGAIVSAVYLIAVVSAASATAM